MADESHGSRPISRGAKPADPVVQLLVEQLDQAFSGRAWHGANLMTSLRGLDPRLAGWRPQPDRHNIIELAVHAAYWKYRVFRSITDNEPRAFELAGSNFFPREGTPTATRWRADVELLKMWHERLVTAVRSMPPKLLAVIPGRGRFTRVQMICGAAAHDIYHAGQIQLIKRLYADRHQGVDR